MQAGLNLLERQGNGDRAQLVVFATEQAGPPVPPIAILQLRGNIELMTAISAG